MSPGTSENAYKIGAADVAGAERVVVAPEAGGLLVLDAPGPAGEAPPTAFRDLLRDWPAWRPRLDAVADGGWPATAVDTVDWRLPHLGDKCLCIGANYTDHISEMDVPPPPWPYSFVVPASTTLVASGTPVEIPRGVQQWDWEAEVAVVLGRRLRYADAEEALAAIALYVPFNDLSARDAGSTRIAFGIDLTMIKAHDNSKVVGSLFTPAQFVPDPQALGLTCEVNGVRKQDLHTSNMIFTFGECVAHLSTIMTLEPGDLIATGTGGGVGALRTPPEFLSPGDTVVVDVEGLGRTETRMLASSA